MIWKTLEYILIALSIWFLSNEQFLLALALVIWELLDLRMLLDTYQKFQDHKRTVSKVENDKEVQKAIVKAIIKALKEEEEEEKIIN